MTSAYLQSQVEKLDDAVQEIKTLVGHASAVDNPQVAFYVGFLSGVLNRLLVTLEVSLTTAKELKTSEKMYSNPELCVQEAIQ
jgi:hypothetical protein